MGIISHYTKLSVLLNHVLDQNEFLMNTISKTNDPYEYVARKIVPTAYDNEVIYTYRDWLNMGYDIIENKIRLGCFVKENDDHNNFSNWSSIKNAPLWAHYGDSNSGVVIVFKKEPFIESCKKYVKYEWAIHANEVDYNNPPQKPGSFKIDRDKIGENTYLNIAKNLFKQASEFWFHKSKDWFYEQEFRIMIFTEENSPAKINLDNTIEAIVFGDRVSNSAKVMIGQYCKERGIRALALSYSELYNKYSVKEL